MHACSANPLICWLQAPVGPNLWLKWRDRLSQGSFAIHMLLARPLGMQDCKNSLTYRDEQTHSMAGKSVTAALLHDSITCLNAQADSAARARPEYWGC